jgi:beta-xylosidase
MLSRHPWITAFIGHVLRRGHAVDPDTAFDTAGELYLDWREVTPEFAADSAFGRTRPQPGKRLKSKLHGGLKSSCRRAALAIRRPP